MRTLVVLFASVLALAGLALPSTSASAAAASGHTRRVVVRPVTAAGTPASGFVVHRQKGSASCTDPSPAAVDDGISICYPSADYLPSCWKSARHSVLCLRDVSRRVLVRIRHSGSYPHLKAPARPSPQALRLLTGQRCTIRIGGAWGTAPHHPGWVGFYSCTNGSVYGPPSGDGIDRSRPFWRVHLLRPDGSMVIRRVAVATFVGTAG